MAEKFDVLRKAEPGYKDGHQYIKVDEVIEGEKRFVEGSDGKNHRGTVRIKRVYCGKKCKGCPHPAFAYLQYRDGKKVTEKYLGKVGE